MGSAGTNLQAQHGMLDDAAQEIDVCIFNSENLPQILGLKCTLSNLLKVSRNQRLRRNLGAQGIAHGLHLRELSHKLRLTWARWFSSFSFSVVAWKAANSIMFQASLGSQCTTNFSARLTRCGQKRSVLFPKRPSWPDGTSNPRKLPPRQPSAAI